MEGGDFRPERTSLADTAIAAAHRFFFDLRFHAEWHFDFWVSAVIRSDWRSTANLRRVDSTQKLT